MEIKDAYKRIILAYCNKTCAILSETITDKTVEQTRLSKLNVIRPTVLRREVQRHTKTFNTLQKIAEVLQDAN